MMLTPQSQDLTLAQAKKLVRELIIEASSARGLPNPGEYGIATWDETFALFIVDKDGCAVELGTFEIVHE